MGVLKDIFSELSPDFQKLGKNLHEQSSEELHLKTFLEKNILNDEHKIITLDKNSLAFKFVTIINEHVFNGYYEIRNSIQSDN